LVLGGASSSDAFLQALAKHRHFDRELELPRI